MGSIKYLILLLLCSCAPRIVTVTEYRDRVHTETAVDTVIIRDSISMTQTLKGDTVYFEKLVYRERERASKRSDTLLVRDSVPYPVEVVKCTNRLTKWQRTQVNGFWVLLVLIVIAVYIKIKCF